MSTTKEDTSARADRRAALPAGRVAVGLAQGLAAAAGDRVTSRVTADELRAALRCGARRCACARPTGPSHCPSHDDRRPSFSVAERNGRVLVHCYSGCGQADVIAALRGRGLWPSFDIETRAALSPLEAARADALARERMAEARRAPHRPAWAAADAYRKTIREVAAARAIATAAGPDAPGVWDALALAAHVETEAGAALAEASE